MPLASQLYILQRNGWEPQNHFPFGHWVNNHKPTIFQTFFATLIVTVVDVTPAAWSAAAVAAASASASARCGGWVCCSCGDCSADEVAVVVIDDDCAGCIDCAGFAATLFSISCRKCEKKERKRHGNLNLCVVLSEQCLRSRFLPC